jgi:hypothetical protein
MLSTAPEISSSTLHTAAVFDTEPATVEPIVAEQRTQRQMANFATKARWSNGSS